MAFPIKSSDPLMPDLSSNFKLSSFAHLVQEVPSVPPTSPHNVQFLERSHKPSCTDRVVRSAWTYLVFTIAIVVLLVIGILASTGVLNAMGTANAAYLSYGMYAGAAAMLLATGLLSCITRRSLRLAMHQSYTPIEVDQPARSPVVVEFHANTALTNTQIEDIRQKTQLVTYTKDDFHDEFNLINAREELRQSVCKILDNPEFCIDPLAHLASLHAEYAARVAGRVQGWEWKAYWAVKNALHEIQNPPTSSYYREL